MTPMDTKIPVYFTGILIYENDNSLIGTWRHQIVPKKTPPKLGPTKLKILWVTSGRCFFLFIKWKKLLNYMQFFRAGAFFSFAIIHALDKLVCDQSQYCRQFIFAQFISWIARKKIHQIIKQRFFCTLGQPFFIFFCHIIFLGL